MLLALTFDSTVHLSDLLTTIILPMFGFGGLKVYRAITTFINRAERTADVVDIHTDVLAKAGWTKGMRIPRVGTKLLLLLCLLLSVPCSAQSHTDVVASVKNALQARSVTLADSCGAFAITARVAYTLRGEGAGLLAKPTGNNCQGFATDIIVYADGHAFDILHDAGGSNGPAWDAIDPVDTSRWRAPMDLDGGSTPPTPVPVPVPAPIPSIDLSAVLQRLDGLSLKIDQLSANQTQQHVEQNDQRTAQTAAIKAAIDSPGWFVTVFGNRYVQLALMGVSTYVATHQVMK